MISPDSNLEAIKSIDFIDLISTQLISSLNQKQHSSIRINLKNFINQTTAEILNHLSIYTNKTCNSSPRKFSINKSNDSILSYEQKDLINLITNFNSSSNSFTGTNSLFVKTNGNKTELLNNINSSHSNSGNVSDLNNQNNNNNNFSEDINKNNSNQNFTKINKNETNITTNFMSTNYHENYNKNQVRLSIAMVSFIFNKK